MNESTATRILEAWKELEGALRSALPVCSVQPPTQPSELLAALRINRVIGAQEEERIQTLREVRTRVAHAPDEPSPEEADHFEAEVRDLMGHLVKGPSNAC
jgi:hypothetical protein